MEIGEGEEGALFGRRRRRHNRKRCINIVMSFGEKGKKAVFYVSNRRKENVDESWFYVTHIVTSFPKTWHMK
jgi:hypothetical protein